VTIKTVTRTTEDFVEAQSVEERTQKCVIQVARPEDLNNDTLDWSLKHLLIHSRSTLAMRELVEYKDEDYIIVRVSGWNDYGYIEAIASQTKKPLVEPDE
jgi:hypothetical protein